MPFANVITGLLSTEDNPDILDDVADLLEEIIGGDADYDIIAWERGTGTYILIYGPLSVREIVYEDLIDISVMPHSLVIHEMNNTSNEWLIPAPSRRSSPYAVAESKIAEWKKSMLTGPSPSREVKSDEQIKSKKTASVSSDAAKMLGSFKSSLAQLGKNMDDGEVEIVSMKRGE